MFSWLKRLKKASLRRPSQSIWWLIERNQPPIHVWSALVLPALANQSLPASAFASELMSDCCDYSLAANNHQIATHWSFVAGAVCWYCNCSNVPDDIDSSRCRLFSFAPPGMPLMLLWTRPPDDLSGFSIGDHHFCWPNLWSCHRCHAPIFVYMFAIDVCGWNRILNTIYNIHCLLSARWEITYNCCLWSGVSWAVPIWLTMRCIVVTVHSNNQKIRLVSIVDSKNDYSMTFRWMARICCASAS